MEKSEFRILIKHCFLMGKNIMQTKQCLYKYYGESFPSRRMVEKWNGKFKRGRTSTNDAEWSRRPNDVTSPENIEEIHEIVLDDPKVKVLALAEATGI